MKVENTNRYYILGLNLMTATVRNLHFFNLEQKHNNN